VAPILGLVSPSMFAAVPSILMIVWVAVGGRGSLYGALLGALVVAFGEDLLSERYPQDWELYQGVLFVVVIAFAPGGIWGIARGARRLPDRVRRRRDPVAALEAMEAAP
jgi:urea transport system permease protein